MIKYLFYPSHFPNTKLLQFPDYECLSNEKYLLDFLFLLNQQISGLFERVSPKFQMNLETLYISIPHP